MPKTLKQLTIIIWHLHILCVFGTMEEHIVQKGAAMPIQISDNAGSVPPKPQSGSPLNELDAKITDLKERGAELGQRMEAEANRLTAENLKRLSVELNTAEQRDRSADTQRPSKQTARDNAQLSEDSRLYKLTPEELEQLMKQWTLDSEAAQWDKLLNWLPPGGSVPEELKQLLEIYEALLKAVLSHTSGMEQQVQLNRLDQALLRIIEKYCSGSLRDLDGFFMKFGGRDTTQTMRTSVFQSITGHAPASNEMEQPVKPIEHGIIYQKEGDRQISASQSFHRQVQSDRKAPPDQRLIGHRDARKQAAVPGFERNGCFAQLSGSSAKLYSASDLQKAQKFASYIEHEGNLFEIGGLDANNEELLGLLSAVMSMKAQIYPGSTGIGTAMRVELETAVDKMIDSYLSIRLRPSDTTVSDQEARAFQGVQKKQTSSGQHIYKVYYHILELYRSEGRPKQAIFRGMQYALRLFMEKKGDDGFRQLARYSKDSGFFHAHLGDGGVAPRLREDLELEKGKKALERDWNRFTNEVKKERGRKASEDHLDQSPWGTLVEPEESPSRAPYRQIILTILTMALICLIAVLFRQIV